MTDSATPASAANTCPPVIPSTRRPATLLKLGVIAVLVFLSLIPLALLRGVINERHGRYREAINNITSTWGQDQILAGPLLVVPYVRHFKVWKDQVINNRAERIEVTESAVAQAWFLPNELKVEGELQPDRLHRAIYEAIVYRAALKVTGSFAKPSFEMWGISPEDIRWHEAFVAVGISDLRGTKETLNLEWGGAKYALEPGTRVGLLGAGVHARLLEADFTADTVPFAFTLNLHGSGNLSFAPFGTQNRVRLSSPWPDPSFNGAFLPTHRSVSAAGFEADWQLSYYGRSYPTQGADLERGDTLQATGISASLFGLTLHPGVDTYRLAERSVKYGILFITVVFAAFFLLEVLAPVRLHPFQYTLISAALCLFYLVLLSLSEFIAFGWAYLAAAAGAILMISLYTSRALASRGRALAVGGCLTAVYAYLYIILRQQEYSLLYGAAGLFLLLALVMYITRRIDWYARDNP